MKPRQQALRQRSLRIILSCSGLLFAGQAVGLFWGAQELRGSKRALTEKQRGLAALTQAQPAATQAAAAELARDIAAAQAALDQAAALWRDNEISRALDAAHEGHSAALPASPRAAYFDLVRYRQQMSELAREQAVQVGTAEFFGFGDYAHEGPEQADIAQVYAQRLLLTQVVGALLRSQPQQLLGITRVAGAEGRRAEVALAGASDAAAPLPEHFSRTRFQIRFRGRTATLRTWLNELARSRLPVVVCRVAVAPAVESAIALQAATVSPQPVAPLPGGPAAAGFELLVRPAESEFAVTLDYLEAPAQPGAVELLAPAQASVSPASQSAVAQWPVPPLPQASGAPWRFELFSPPEIFYNAGRLEFRLGALAAGGGLEATGRPVPAPLRATAAQLLAVQYEAYPLQLRGFVGEPRQAGGFWGIFENRETGETLLLRPGDRVAALGLELVGLRAELVPVEASEPGSLRQWRAVARVRDADGALLHTLREGERAAGPALVAQLSLGGETRELREGATWTGSDGSLWVLEKIEVEPTPHIFLKRLGPDAAAGAPGEVEAWYLELAPAWELGTAAATDME